MAYFGIPSRDLPLPDHRAARLSGLGDPEEVQFRRGAEALKAALDLNPRGGYVQGSPAREALDRAIAIIPDARAAQLVIHLIDGRGPIADLFRYRLAWQTRSAIFRLLQKKNEQAIIEAQQKLERLEEEQRRRPR